MELQAKDRAKMAITTTTVTAPEAELPFTLKLAHHDASYLPIARFQTIDGLLKSHAAEPEQTPLICYPRSTASDFELHTGKDLDQYTDAAVQFYLQNGLEPAVSAGDDFGHFCWTDDLQRILLLKRRQ